MKTLAAAFLASTLLYAPAHKMRPYAKQIPAQKNLVTPAFKQEVTNAIRKLKTTNNYTIVISASWCMPCRALKHDLHSKNLDAKIEAWLPAEEWDQRDYLLSELQKNGLPPFAGIPALYQNSRNEVWLSVGYDAAQEIMFAPQGERSKKLEKIVK